MEMKFVKAYAIWSLDLLGISNKGTKAKSIPSCDNSLVTNIVRLSFRWHYAFAPLFMEMSQFLQANSSTRMP